MSEILIEGGLGGHMPHLYENGNLTFGEIKDVFKQASKGQLKGTEKTDGQNLKLSFNVKTQKALGARNATQIKSGGLSIEEMYGYFANHRNPKLKFTFSDAVKIFEKAVKLLDVNTQIEIFGPEANNWYNAEVMDDRSPNVVSYDARNLLIHRTGHVSYDKKTGKEIEKSDIDKKANKFMSFLSKVQNSVSNKRHAILANPIQNLKELDNKEALRVAFYKLEHTISKYSLSDDNTINDFLKAELSTKLKTNIPSEIKDSIINSTLGIAPKVNKRELKKQITPEMYEELNLLIDSIPSYIKAAIKPIELIVTDFAAEMLKTLESIFILDNKAETARLAKEVESAIQKIQSSENKGDIAFLNSQLEKLKDTQSISSAVEGFAFSYKGVIYKFTGKFAPVNQILGLSKYGRGKKDTTTELDEQQASVRTFDTALLGGGFKPPHKGHIELIKQLAGKADNVIIYTSDKSSQERKFKSGELKGQVIDGKKCNALLEEIISTIPELKNVNLVITNTPLKEIFDYVEKTSKFGESILIGVGDKEEDAKRFDNISKYIPPEKKLKVQILPLQPVIFDGEPLSASRLREAISNKNVDRVASFIPNEIFNKTEFANKIINMFVSKKNSFTEEVFEEVMGIFTNENKLDEMSAMAAGATTGHVDSNKGRKKKMKIDRKIFMEELELRKTIRKALLLRETKRKKQLSEEQQLRHFIRQLIKEAKEEVTNFDNTGLNFLAEFFRDSLKQMEVGFKSLKTNQQQRDSFKAHLIKNLETLVKREAEQMSIGGDRAASDQELEEEINLSIDEPVDDKILDLGLDKKSKKADKDNYQFQRMSDHEQTGAERAEEVFDQIKDNALEQIRKLHDPEDRAKFIDYMTPNLVSWIEQWNGGLQKQAEPKAQTPEGAQTATPPDQGTV